MTGTAAPAVSELGRLAALEPDAVLTALDTTRDGLSDEQVTRRRAAVGPNAVRTHAVTPWAVLARQFANPVQALLLGAAALSLAVGNPVDAAIVIVIVLTGVGLGFVNEWRSERAIADLHDRVRHRATVRRDARDVEVDVVELVPGDLVRLAPGQLVPADVRLIEAAGLACNESVLTGEAVPVAKHPAAVHAGESPLDLPSCAFMGTIVTAGTGLAAVAATGGRTVFGEIALELGERHERTAFETGLRSFTRLLVRVTGALVVLIATINLVRGQPVLDTGLFALSIAVGLVPQLLPALVTLSLARGSRQLARAEVVVKRLVAIEGLGNIDMLFTDKTGTLTTGQLSLLGANDPLGRPDDEVLALARACSDVTMDAGTVTGGNPLDRALWEGASLTVTDWRVLARLPFDHDRQLTSVLLEHPARGRIVVTKGAPEGVLSRCEAVPAESHPYLEAQFADGVRLIAVAVRPAPEQTTLDVGDEQHLALAGFVGFTDPPKDDVAAALERLAELGITVKVVTGDNPVVAQHLCRQVGLEVAGTLTGVEIDQLDDAGLAVAVGNTTIFGRVTPDQKSRILRAARTLGATVAFLGDGVNDAVALHTADVGISVDTATDVAKDAASVVLTRSDLSVLAAGVTEGRTVFANTMKYIFMATSSNFGNMFSLTGASLLVRFLPLLPTQVLLNNLLYDVSQTTIPGDRVDDEQLRRPAHWDLRLIRRFMMVFGPLSSVFDFLTFALLITWFSARTNAELFRTAWFVESLLTQTLVVFVIRTRRTPFWRSRPARALAATTAVCALVAMTFPFTPLAGTFGFITPSLRLLATIVALAGVYLLLVDQAKRWFYRTLGAPVAVVPVSHHLRRVHRRAAPFSTR